jgi:hypothetical protein
VIKEGIFREIKNPSLDQVLSMVRTRYNFDPGGVASGNHVGELRAITTFTRENIGDRLTIVRPIKDYIQPNC